MIEKPKIEDKKIITALSENYSIQASHLEFLPIGNDASAFAYRVEAKNGVSYFLKLKLKIPNRAALFVPRFLRDCGIEQIVSPLSTNSQNLSAGMEGFSLILYPFIPGQEAMQIGMTDTQWSEFGSTLKRIHATKLDPNLLEYVKSETFISKWGNLARALHEQVNTREYEDPYQKRLASFWKENNKIIQNIIAKTEIIGQRLQQSDLEFVLCRADIHTANILITTEHSMFIVDWDETLLAPKERDLMFILEDSLAKTREQQYFIEGYGSVAMNRLALAYYRYEWCVQEIGDFGERVFLTKDAGETTKQASVEGFMELFSQGDVIQTAFNTLAEI